MYRVIAWHAGHPELLPKTLTQKSERLIIAFGCLFGIVLIIELVFVRQRNILFRIKRQTYFKCR